MGKDELCKTLITELKNKNDMIDYLKKKFEKFTKSQYAILGLDSNKGGRSDSYIPRRTNPWYIKKIIPGTLKKKALSKKVNRAKNKLKTAVFLGALKERPH